MTKEILDEEAKNKIQKFPLPYNTMKDRIDKMSFDVKEQLLVKVKKSPFYSLQCNESTNISECYQ